MLYTLMNKDEPVLDFAYDKAQHAVLAVTGVHDLNRAPLSIWNERVARFATWETLASLVGRWWQRRGIPDSRLGLTRTKRLAGFDTPAQLTAQTCGFSLIDQYWARPEDSDLTWAQGNFFLNDFDDGIGLILAGISQDTGNHSPVSPSATVDGNLPKMWHVGAEGVRELHKAGSGALKQEPFNEVVATLLYGRLFATGTYVPYRCERQGFGYYSVCPCFVDAEHEFVTARDLHGACSQSLGSHTLRSLVSAAESQGVPHMRAHLDQLFVCDYILGNVDRHLGNFGIVRHQQDATFERMAPIFDSGLSLLCLGGDHDQDALAVLANPLMPRQAQQLALTEDLSWFDVAALDGFPDEAIEVLGGCPSRYMDAERLHFLHAFIASGIRTVAEAAGLTPLDPDDIASVELRAQDFDRLRGRLMREEGCTTVLHV